MPCVGLDCIQGLQTDCEDAQCAFFVAGLQSREIDQFKAEFPWLSPHATGVFVVVRPIGTMWCGVARVFVLMLRGRVCPTALPTSPVHMFASGFLPSSSPFRPVGKDEKERLLPDEGGDEGDPLGPVCRALLCSFFPLLYSSAPLFLCCSPRPLFFLRVHCYVLCAIASPRCVSPQAPAVAVSSSSAPPLMSLFSSVDAAVRVAVQKCVVRASCWSCW